jgi:hypothetical protein
MDITLFMTIIDDEPLRKRDAEEQSPKASGPDGERAEGTILAAASVPGGK